MKGMKLIMSREFSTSEIIRQKCSICGMNNKKYTELVYNNETCGYKLTCCNCGHVDTFIEDDDHIATYVYGNSTIYYVSEDGKGREICIHHTTCKNRACKYHGKYPLWRAVTQLDDILNDIDQSNDCTCGSNNCTCNNSGSVIKNSDSDKLDINGYEINKPKFH